MPPSLDRILEDIIQLLKGQILQTKVSQQIPMWNGINFDSIGRIVQLALRNREKLHASVVPDHKKPVWRVNEIYFTPVKRPRVASGCLNFSPGWLAQGHHRPEDPLVTSLTLSQGNKDSTLEWLEQIDKLQILSNILIKLLHPELYEAGLTALSGLRHESQTIDWATRWNSVFTWAEMWIKELGAHFRYCPGTVFIFSGKLWTHEVPRWMAGERVLYAYFMRPEVLNRFIRSPVGWAQVLS
ncbi:hypothetical protein GG344DRAFT_70701 [Lentinula edodes]|nr:hypothetical protein GG344DRAFT_70701 [Lentinula edodes]